MQLKIPNYQIVRLIGSGGMGEVYEAVHDQIQRRAAIKVLRAMFAKNQEVAQRFLNEARAVNIISHPSLVNIYEFGQADDGSPYIVMELLEGETLRQRQSRVGRLSPQQAMDFTRQIASALAVAHSKQIVHRDLKPVNLIIISDPDVASGERIKVVDFGIAKIISEVGDEALTRTGTAMGTPRYMSPEQCKSARSVTDRADVYMLGLILYEMLCGDSPYAEIKSDVRLMEAQMVTPAPPLAAKGTGASPELCALVHRMLAKQPEARPSAAEVATTLRKLTGGLASATISTLAGPVPEAGVDPPTAAPGSAAAPTTPANLPATAGDLGPPATWGRLLIFGAAATLLLGVLGLVVVLRFVLRQPGQPAQPVAVHWHIVSDPPDAEVVDETGFVVGRTPFDRTQPPGLGSVTVTVRRSGFRDGTLTLSRSQDATSQIALSPIPPAQPAVDPSAAVPTAEPKKGGNRKKRAGHSR